MSRLLTIGGLALGGTALATLLVVGAASAAETAPPGARPMDWRDSDAPRRIRAYASAIEKAANWPGLGDYLAAVAYGESRGNPGIVGDSGRSYGWFQIRSSSWCLQELGLTAQQLVNAGERIQVVAAACHAYRLARNYSSPGQRIEWRDLRRGWKFPSWVAQQHRGTAGGLTSERNLRKGYRAVRVPEGRADDAAFRKNFRWPGLQSLLDATRQVKA